MSVHIRGSRQWFTDALDKIECIGGEAARAEAAQIWASSGYGDPSAIEQFAEMLQHRVRLQRATKHIRDLNASRKIKRILESGDTQEIIRISNLLSDTDIERAIVMQGRDECQIIKLARNEHQRSSNHPNTPSELAIRRRLRKETKQAVAHINATLSLIGGRTGRKYATGFEIELRNEQKARWREFGERNVLELDGQQVSMLDIMSSAGKKRFAELYALTKGLEKHAKLAGMTWAFLTLTAPPQMHPNPTVGSEKWDGTKADEAHDWIHDAWHRAESRLRKANIVISGLRVTEPHADGCPHWHALIFVYPDQMTQIETVLREQEEWKNEVGMTFKLNNGEATAATYTTKYVLKTIGSVEELAGDHAAVDAWRSTWGIRAFQFFGMPPLALWRNMRALPAAPQDPLMAGMWRAVKRGDGATFIGLAGGIGVKNSDRPIRSVKKSDSYSPEKSLNFEVKKTGKTESFTFKKWARTPLKTRKDGAVEVIQNYPRNHPQPRAPGGARKSKPVYRWGQQDETGTETGGPDGARRTGPEGPAPAGGRRPLHCGQHFELRSAPPKPRGSIDGPSKIQPDGPHIELQVNKPSVSSPPRER